MHTSMKKTAIVVLTGMIFASSCITQPPDTRDRRGEKVYLDEKQEQHGYYTVYNGEQLGRDRNGAKDYKPKSHMRADQWMSNTSK